MTATLPPANLDPRTWTRLQERAHADGCSVNDLLDRWLAAEKASGTANHSPIEDVLRRTEARLRYLLESAPVVIFSAHAGGDYATTFISDNVRALTGYPPDAFLAEPDFWFAHLHPEDGASISTGLKTITARGGGRLEYRFRRADGVYCWLRADVQAVATRDGAPGELVGSLLDITDQHEAQQMALEQERLKAALNQARDFNATIQNAIAALTHDLRTPLTVIATSKDLLRYYFDQLGIQRRLEKLDVIGQQIDYATELLNDLGRIAGLSLRSRPFQPALLNLEALCRLIVTELEETDGGWHALSFETDGQVQFVYVDELLVSRILLNLLSNAVKYSPAGSVVRLGMHRHDDWVMLEVFDQGIGMSDDDQRRVFEPFFRADSVANIEGTGLGLSIVQDCVGRHGGHLSVKSALGHGTTFTIALPLRQAAD